MPDFRPYFPYYRTQPLGHQEQRQGPRFDPQKDRQCHQGRNPASRDSPRRQRYTRWPHEGPCSVERSPGRQE